MLLNTWDSPVLSVGALDIERFQVAIVGGGALFVAVVLGVVVSFLVRYRTRPGTPSERSVPAEPTRPFAAVSVAVLVAAVFGAGLLATLKDTVPPESGLSFAARQSYSSWTFTYPDGNTQNDKVLVPLHRPVTFDVSNEDDTPAFFDVPELRLRAKVDTGALKTVSFEPSATGTAHVIGPKGPVAEIHVVSEAEFDEYMKVGPSNPYCPSPDGCTAEMAARWGEDLFAQNACIGCHSRDGSRLVGPSFKGVYGRDETMTTGLVVHIDEAYMRESIRKPQAKIVKGFENAQMPSFAGLSDRKVDALIAYLKTVK